MASAHRNRYGHRIPRIGFHCSHEQIPPSRLLRDVQHAEQAGFDAAMCSDHFAPWGSAQGESGFAWSFLGAALATTNLTFGVVNAPGQRYHPAIVAQAAATLNEMFPERLWVALGSGEAANEHITGQPWPDKGTRNARLLECVHVMRALFAGEEVSHDGLIRVDRARLWTRPAVEPVLIAPAVSVETAAMAGSWADGLVTINQPIEHLERMIAAFRTHGGEGKRLALQVHLSWAPTEAEALRLAHEQAKTMILGPPLAWDLVTVEQFDQVGEFVRPEDMHESVIISSDVERHLDRLHELAALGFDEIYLHHAGQDQDAFIDCFGEHVLPRLKA